MRFNLLFDRSLSSVPTQIRVSVALLTTAVPRLLHPVAVKRDDILIIQKEGADESGAEPKIERLSNVKKLVEIDKILRDVLFNNVTNVILNVILILTRDERTRRFIHET